MPEHGTLVEVNRLIEFKRNLHTPQKECKSPRGVKVLKDEGLVYTILMQLGNAAVNLVECESVNLGS